MPDDPRQMTSTEMRSEAEELERVAKSYLERAKQLREVAALVDGLAKAPVQFETKHVPSREDYDTNETMNASAIVSPPVKKRRTGAPLRAKGPVGRVAKLLGITIREVAAKVGANYETARVWNNRGKAPDDIQVKLDALEDGHKKAMKSGK